MFLEGVLPNHLTPFILYTNRKLCRLLTDPRPTKRAKQEVEEEELKINGNSHCIISFCGTMQMGRKEKNDAHSRLFVCFVIHAHKHTYNVCIRVTIDQCFRY